MPNEIINENKSADTNPETTNKTSLLLLNDVNELVSYIDDEVSKKYLRRLKNMETHPPDKTISNTDEICMFRITQMMYGKGEQVANKLASVLNSVQHLNIVVYLILDSKDGQKTDFYMGIRLMDKERTPKIWQNALQDALHGHFPGIKTEEVKMKDKEALIKKIQGNEAITSVSCVAQNRDEEMLDGELYTQGLENLVRAMQGKSYTVVIIAQGKSADETDRLRAVYENAYSLISPLANMRAISRRSSVLTLNDKLSNSNIREEISETNNETKNETSESKVYESAEQTDTNEKTTGMRLRKKIPFSSIHSPSSTTLSKKVSGATQTENISIHNQLEVVSSITNQINSTEQSAIENLCSISQQFCRYTLRENKT